MLFSGRLPTVVIDELVDMFEIMESLDDTDSMRDIWIGWMTTFYLPRKEINTQRSVP